MDGGSASAQGESSPGGSSDDGKCCSWILMFLAILLPNMVFLVFCTDITEWGTWLVDQVSSKDQSVHGDIAVCGAALLVVVYYVLDWASWRYLPKVLFGGLMWVHFVLGSVLKGRKYPAAIRVSVLLHVPLLLAFIRLRWDKRNRSDSRHNFYFMVGCVSLMFASLWFIIFVLYLAPVPGVLPVISLSHYWEESKYRMMMKLTDMYKYVLEDAELSPRDCLLDNPQNVSVNGSSTLEDGQKIPGELRLKVLAACRQADVVMVFLWVSPMIACFGFILLCFICIAIFAHVDATRGDQIATKEVVTPLVMGITICVSGMAVSTLANGVTVDPSNGLIALGCWSFGALVIFFSFELSTPERENLAALILDNIRDTEQPSRVRQVLDNEWVRAVLVSCGLLPGLMMLEELRERFRRNSFSEDDDYSELDHPDSRLFDRVLDGIIRSLAKWNWPSVLVKVCELGYLYFAFRVGVTQVSKVLFAILNENLKQKAYGYSVAIVFGVGIAMLLLPRVPGVFVYISCGIVLATERDDIAFGFWVLSFLAVAMSMVLKLLASIVAYLIGHIAGTNARVQRLAGVGTDDYKAIEYILMGNNVLEKIVLLVGGLDSSTSLLCGILKVNVPSMLLLTVPAVNTMAPCVIGGAALWKVTPLSRNYETTLALAVGLSWAGAAMQLGFFALAQYFISRVKSSVPDLTDERPIPEAVQSLIREEEEKGKAIQTEMLDCFERQDGAWWTIVAAAVLNILSNVVFTSELAFENFAVSGQISDDLDEFGLGGNPWNIVRPAGWGAMEMFGLSLFLHIAFTSSMRRRAGPREFGSG